MSKTKQPKTIHVISGTHWDREWRYTADQSLLRLVELVDELLEILEKNDDYKCFHLDGGTIVMEDYLQVRPENKERISKLIKAGKIQSVMWYTLPEMSSVSPESLIRNLLIGKRYAEEFGGAMKTGYTATSYGQISQLPQIYSGFGMNTAMSYRGTNKHQVPPLCLWESPDGSKIFHIRCFDEVTRTNWFFFPHYELVLGKSPRDLSTEWREDEWPVHMADEKLYETAFQLKNEKFGFNTDKEKLLSALKHLVKQAEPQMIGSHILALDMEDNAVPYFNLPKMIEAMNSVQKGYFIKQSSLDEYVESALKEADKKKLKKIKGEMRFTGIEAGFNGLLGATHSSRTYLKLMNDESQRELINIAEPLCSINSMLGNTYEQNLLDRAWRELLKNHAHDSICGAAIDIAHKDNPSRFRATTSIARECCRKACEEIWINTDTKSKFKDGDLTLTFFNTLPIARKSVEQLVIDAPKITVGDVVIEPCTGVGPIIEGYDPDKEVSYMYFDIIDEKGKKVPYKLLEREDISIEVERKLDSNAAVYKVQRNRVLVEVDVPAFGHKTYALRPRTRKYEKNPKPKADRKLIAAQDGVLENEFIKLKINANGTFDLTDKKTKKTVEGMHYFSDNGSIGAAHINKFPMRDYTVTTLGNSALLTLVENNELRATWKVDLEMKIPASADLDGRNRSEKTVTIPITTYVSLRRGAKFLEIKTKLTNVARDHRLRVMFPTDVKTDFAYADGPFDILKRQIQWDEVAENMESYHPFKPMLNFVDLSDAKAGMAFMSKGLNEYEAMDDKRRTLAITLIRTTRHYMAANRSLFTPEEYEKHHSGQHCLGDIEFEYALYPHSGEVSLSEVFNVSQDYKVDVRVIQGIPKKGKLPCSGSFIKLAPTDKIHISAFYKADSGKNYILRLWNSSKKKTEVKLSSYFKFKSVKKVTMDEETELSEIKQKGGKWSFSAKPAEIITLLIKM